jgi:putative ABC transport system permease protein
LRRALGARKWHIRAQFLAEALCLMLIGGFVGILLSYVISAAVGELPLLGPLFEDTSGQGDIRLHISAFTVIVSSGILLVVGVLSGLVPAFRASQLNPVEALRYE